jgi:hypothetical protein
MVVVIVDDVAVDDVSDVFLMFKLKKSVFSIYPGSVFGLNNPQSQRRIITLVSSSDYISPLLNPFQSSSPGFRVRCAQTASPYFPQPSLRE